MGTEITTRQSEPLPETVEQLIAHGDLAQLTTPQRIQYYKVRCDAAGLDARCRPFQFIQLNGKLVLYATKECAEQLNGLHGISHRILATVFDRDTRLLEVTVEASRLDGRSTQDIGVVFCQEKKGEDLANAKMKAVTKAKRRATLSLCGLGDVTDETELDTVETRVVNENGNALPVDNGSGHGSGKYASDEQTEEFLANMGRYLDMRNQRWFDRWADKGVSGLKDLCNQWQADGHLAKWAEQCGYISPGSLPADGKIRNRQIGRLTAIVYHNSQRERKALAKELESYIDKQEQISLVKLQKGHPELFEPVDTDNEPDDGEIMGDEFGEARDDDLRD